MYASTFRRSVRRCTLTVAVVTLAASGAVAASPATADQAVGDGCGRSRAPALEIADRVTERKVAQAQDRVDLAWLYR